MADQNKTQDAPKEPTAEDRLAMALEVIEQQGERLAALEGKLEPKPEAKVEKLETPKEAFKLDKVSYKFNVPKYIDNAGVLRLSKDSLADPAELERLVSIRSGIITKQK